MKLSKKPTSALSIFAAMAVVISFVSTSFADDEVDNSASSSISDFAGPHQGPRPGPAGPGRPEEPPRGRPEPFRPEPPQPFRPEPHPFRPPPPIPFRPEPIPVPVEPIPIPVEPVGLICSFSLPADVSQSGLQVQYSGNSEEGAIIECENDGELAQNCEFYGSNDIVCN